jgi:hypothetical protein
VVVAGPTGTGGQDWGRTWPWSAPKADARAARLAAHACNPGRVEAAMGRMEVRGRPGETVPQTPSPK